MPPTPAKALSFALLLGTAACASGGRAPARPMPAASIRLPVPAQPAPSAQAPEQIQESFPIEGAAGAVRGNLLGNARYDLPVEANRWVELELDFLVSQRRAVIGTWLSRADRYQGFVQETFASYGIPRDLHHLAMVESGYLPTARSHAGAVGMWQFMAATGRGMGLRIDDVVDERMDPVRATHAAARHLRDLHRDFRGDWALAAAAYNAGSGRINRGLGRFGATNFWELAERGDLAQETRHYVPRLFAVTIIGRDPARFGYPAPAGTARVFRPDSVRVDVETPVAELARIGNLNASDLTELNPHLFRGIAPAGYKVWTPTGSGPAIQAAFDSSAFRRSGGFAWYTLRRGENVAQVATAAGISIDRIRELNLSLSVERLGAGDRVRLPAPLVRTLAARPVERERLASANDEPRGPSSPEMDAARADARRLRAARREEERAAEARRVEERAAEARRAEERRLEERAAATRRTEERAAEARRVAARDAEEKPRAEESTPRRATEERVASRAASDDSRSERPAAVRPRRAASEDSSSERATRTAPRRASEDSSSERTTRRASADSTSERTTRTASRRASADSSSERTTRTAARRASEDSSSERTARSTTRRASTDSTTRTAARRTRPDSAARTASRETPRRTGETTERAETRARTHVVERGETLRGLAETYGVTVAQLRAANEIPAGEGVEVGQRLRLPRAAGSASTLATASERAARARASSEATPERRTARPDSSARRTPSTEASRPSQHTVQPGETLYGIARKYGVAVDALRTANDVDADNTIQPGQKLRIPRS